MTWNTQRLIVKKISKVLLAYVGPMKVYLASPGNLFKTTIFTVTCLPSMSSNPSMFNIIGGLDPFPVIIKDSPVPNAHANHGAIFLLTYLAFFYFKYFFARTTSYLRAGVSSYERALLGAIFLTTAPQRARKYQELFITSGAFSNNHCT